MKASPTTTIESIASQLPKHWQEFRTIEWKEVTFPMRTGACDDKPGVMQLTRVIPVEHYLFICPTIDPPEPEGSTAASFAAAGLLLAIGVVVGGLIGAFLIHG